MFKSQLIAGLCNLGADDCRPGRIGFVTQKVWYKKIFRLTSIDPLHHAGLKGCLADEGTPWWTKSQLCLLIGAVGSEHAALAANNFT